MLSIVAESFSARSFDWGFLGGNAIYRDNPILSCFVNSTPVYGNSF